MVEPSSAPRHAENDEVPPLRAKHVALDFLNSRALIRGEDVEWIRSGPSLLAWLNRAGLLSGLEVRRYSAQHSLTQMGKTAVVATELRRWLLDAVEALQRSEPLPDPRVLNQVLAVAWTGRVLRAGPTGLTWNAELAVREPLAPLGRVAEAMCDLLADVGIERVRRCAAHDCRLWFLDLSRNRKGLWCSMATCGTRHKVAAYRERSLRAAADLARTSPTRRAGADEAG